MPLFRGDNTTATSVLMRGSLMSGQQWWSRFGEPVNSGALASVDASQPDLSGAVLPGYNFVAGNTNTADDNGHGTAVAGVVAAHTGNGVGYVGVCDGCKILPVKVLAHPFSAWAPVARYTARLLDRLGFDASAQVLDDDTALVARLSKP